MTKKKQATLTSATMLADLNRLVCDPRADDATRTQAVSIAYELGRSEGRVDGAISMGDKLVASINGLRP